MAQILSQNRKFERWPYSIRLNHPRKFLVETLLENIEYFYELPNVKFKLICEAPRCFASKVWTKVFAEPNGQPL